MKDKITKQEYIFYVLDLDTGKPVPKTFSTSFALSIKCFLNESTKDKFKILEFNATEEEYKEIWKNVKDQYKIIQTVLTREYS